MFEHITLNIGRLEIRCPSVSFPEPKQLILTWHVGPVSDQKFPGPKQKRCSIMQQLTDTQQVRIEVVITDKKGGPAPVQSPVFESSDVNVITVGPDDTDPTNPLKALVKANLAGAATLKFNADADMGDGVNPIRASLDFQVTGGAASTIAINAGIPEEQP